MARNRASALQIIDPILTGLARSYRAHGFIGPELVPAIPVSTLSGQYPVFTKDHWFAQEVDVLVKDRAPAKEVDFEWSTETYLAEEYALKVSITDLERLQAQAALRLEQSKVEFLALRMALAREVRIANLLQDPVVLSSGGLKSGNSAAPSAKWDTSSATPEDDIRAAVLAIYGDTGLLPNTIVIPYPVAYNLATRSGTNTFRGKILYTTDVEAIRVGPGILPSEIHGLRVVIPRGPQVKSGREGTDGATYSEIWGKHVRILYVDGAPNWGTPSVAYRFQHTEQFASRWRETDPDVDYVRLWERVDEKVCAPELGYVLTNCIS